ADNVCPTLLFGNPWLATNGSRVLYSNLATTVANPSIDTDNPDSVAVAKSLDAGLTWSPMRIALQDPTFPVDKPSMSRFGNTAVITAVRVGGLGISPIIMATSDDAGDTWMPLAFLFVFEAEQRINPIVRLRSNTLGYVAYMHSTGTPGIADIRIVRVTR